MVPRRAGSTQDWNDQHPERQVKAGDTIIEAGVGRGRDFASVGRALRCGTWAGPADLASVSLAKSRLILPRARQRFPSLPNSYRGFGAMFTVDRS